MAGLPPLSPLAALPFSPVARRIGLLRLLRLLCSAVVAPPARSLEPTAPILVQGRSSVQLSSTTPLSRPPGLPRPLLIDNPALPML